MTLRIVHPRQQGARLAWSDSMFEQVDYVEHTPPAQIEEIPQPEVSELQWPQLVGLVASAPETAGQA